LNLIENDESEKLEKKISPFFLNTKTDGNLEISLVSSSLFRCHLLFFRKKEKKRETNNTQVEEEDDDDALQQ